MTAHETDKRVESRQCPTKVHLPSTSRKSRPCTSARRTSRAAPESGALIAHPPAPTCHQRTLHLVCALNEVCTCPIKGLRLPQDMIGTNPENRRLGYARV